MENQNENQNQPQSDQVYCPFCGSTNLITNQKGFGAGKALTGALLTGGIGLLAGFIGSKDIKVTCMHCKETIGIEGVQTTPPSEELKREFLKARSPERYKSREDKKNENVIMIIITILLLPIILLMCSSIS